MTPQHISCIAPIAMTIAVGITMPITLGNGIPQRIGMLARRKVAIRAPAPATRSTASLPIQQGRHGREPPP
ncbi:uncharacterized protein TrAtP1_006729 [Trichoderma atroviride]|uniref:uncharacterized protein n=1 Tax=Hypocrea atroviridis TaxID=63577 RepID=UPI0033188EE7|nr:hypothetical protein TrAtP1_006729 [Trichoderma atroviride]